jgi:hypothetical protein
MYDANIAGRIVIFAGPLQPVEIFLDGEETVFNLELTQEAGCLAKDLFIWPDGFILGDDKADVEGESISSIFGVL